MVMFTGADFRAAARGLIRTPAVALSAVVCLGLGLGATAAIAGAIQRALLSRLPFRAPDRLVALFGTTPQSGPDGALPQSVPNYADLARETHRLTALAAITDNTGLVTIDGHGAQAQEELVTGNMFSMLGVSAERGRLIAPSDDRLDQPAVAVLSDVYWRTSLGGDPSIVGKTIAIDGTPTTIIGVAPRGFEVPVGSLVFNGDVWMPVRFTSMQLAARRHHYLRVIGRLGDGVTVASAEGELRTLFAGLVSSFPELGGESIRLAPLQPASVQTVRAPLLFLFGAVMLVLMIAASNVAALLLARGVGRRHELAVRTSLGATRWDAMRVSLAESLLITLVGAVVGFGVAEAGVHTIGAMAASQLPQLAGLGINVPVMAFGLVLAIVVALACGAVPAWRGATIDPQDALRASRGATKQQHRSLRSLVVFEIALSVVLLIAAGLALRGFAHLVSNDPGFETAHVLTLQLGVPPTSYPDATSSQQFLHPALDAIAAIPGVESVGAINSPPYVSWGNNDNIRYEGQPPLDPSQLPLVEFGKVTPGFFAVTGQRLIAGRLLRASDDATSAPVVVVNEALAQRDFRGRDAVGARFYISDTTFATIVGVVSSVRNAGPIYPTVPEMYWSYDQKWPGYEFPLLVRVHGSDPTAVVGAIQAAVHRVDLNAAVAYAASMREVIAEDLGRPRFYLGLLGAFAGVALVLALAGLYGVLGYVVAQHTKELGIRAALGGSAGRLVALVTRDGLRMIGAGLLLGLAGGWAVTRLLTFMLYGVSPFDAPTWVVASTLMVAAGLAATLVPALRAARCDPVIAMRADS